MNQANGAYENGWYDACAEFFSDRLFGTHAQLGLEDTLLDMALGVAGGLAYLASAYQRATLGVPARPLTEPEA